ncbi:hypothetical protein Mal15_66670 [Stieleria maiorica]|uniref:Uncharacterized protein n=1 Tax=Stieleria maiorica TaxID=2795974 RepID=A0A5B9MRV8_9BACT|nr:hypothetical protein [Stieleria maiorica]QEG02546.1 hypothetical protein Mal15_66670 [Stieleria maiorica]
MLDLPDGSEVCHDHARVSHRFRIEERLTIGKLIYVTTCCALAFFVYPLIYLYPPSWTWCLIGGFAGSAIGYVLASSKGAISGWIVGLLIVPVAAVPQLLIEVDSSLLLFVITVVMCRAAWTKWW